MLRKLFTALGLAAVATATAQPLIPTTDYTLRFMTNRTSASARAYLEIPEESAGVFGVVTNVDLDEYTLLSGPSNAPVQVPYTTLTSNLLSAATTAAARSVLEITNVTYGSALNLPIGAMQLLKGPSNSLAPVTITAWSTNLLDDMDASWGRATLSLTNQTYGQDWYLPIGAMQLLKGPSNALGAVTISPLMTNLLNDTTTEEARTTLEITGGGSGSVVPVVQAYAGMFIEATPWPAVLSDAGLYTNIVFDAESSTNVCTVSLSEPSYINLAEPGTYMLAYSVTAYGSYPSIYTAAVDVGYDGTATPSIIVGTEQEKRITLTGGLGPNDHVNISMAGFLYTTTGANVRIGLAIKGAYATAYPDTVTVAYAQLTAKRVDNDGEVNMALAAGQLLAGPSNAPTAVTITSLATNLLDDADAATGRATLGAAHGVSISTVTNLASQVSSSGTIFVTNAVDGGSFTWAASPTYYAGGLEITAAGTGYRLRPATFSVVDGGHAWAVGDQFDVTIGGNPYRFSVATVSTNYYLGTNYVATVTLVDTTDTSDTTDYDAHLGVAVAPSAGVGVRVRAVTWNTSTLTVPVTSGTGATYVIVEVNGGAISYGYQNTAGAFAGISGGTYDITTFRYGETAVPLTGGTGSGALARVWIGGQGGVFVRSAAEAGRWQREPAQDIRAEWFGAFESVTGSTTDVGQAMQAALFAARVSEGRAVRLGSTKPDAWYQFGTGLQIPEGVSLIGDGGPGYSGTPIKFTGTGWALTNSYPGLGAPTRVPGPNLERLRIENSTSNTNALGGVRLYKTQYAHIADCNVYYFARDAALSIVSGVSTHVDRSTFQYCRVGIEFPSTYSQLAAVSLRVLSGNTNTYTNVWSGYAVDETFTVRRAASGTYATAWSNSGKEGLVERPATFKITAVDAGVPTDLAVVDGGMLDSGTSYLTNVYNGVSGDGYVPQTTYFKLLDYDRISVGDANTTTHIRGCRVSQSVVGIHAIGSDTFFCDDSIIEGATKSMIVDGVVTLGGYSALFATGKFANWWLAGLTGTNGLVDVDRDGVITTADAITDYSFFGRYNVIDGRVDVDGGGTIGSSDDLFNGDALGYGVLLDLGVSMTMRNSYTESIPHNIISIGRYSVGEKGTSTANEVNLEGTLVYAYSSVSTNDYTATCVGIDVGGVACLSIRNCILNKSTPVIQLTNVTSTTTVPVVKTATLENNWIWTGDATAFNIQAANYAYMRGAWPQLLYRTTGGIQPTAQLLGGELQLVKNVASSTYIRPPTNTMSDSIVMWTGDGNLIATKRDDGVTNLVLTMQIPNAPTNATPQADHAVIFAMDQGTGNAAPMITTENGSTGIAIKLLPSVAAEGAMPTSVTTGDICKSNTVFYIYEGSAWNPLN